MQIHLRRARCVLKSFFVLFLAFFLTTAAMAAEKPRLRVDDYQIQAELTPHLHQISARAAVKFTALQDLNVAVFELHNGLRVTKVLDASNKPLSAERVTQDSTIRVPLPTGPDYVRFVAATTELWVTEPSASQLEIFSLAGDGTPTHAAAIPKARGTSPPRSASRTPEKS